ncbi:MAG TPA: hypothetical protein VK773_11675, partial [Acidimicrobiales bacterium]|nr:hypothetical protein [Acidimicrobiales bacterium]
GTVTVFYGSPTQTQLCQSTLSGGSGDVANFSCSLTASQLAAATYSNVVATYAAGTSSNADFSYNTSTSSPAQSFTVNPSVSTEPTTTALNAVTSSITYGSETAETFTGTVTGQSGDGYPEGTVTVYYGSPTQVALCSQTLPAGSTDVSSFTCSLTATQLAAGSFTNVVAVYSPGGTSSSNSSFTYTTSTSTPAQSFTVNAASESTTTSLNAIATSTTYGSETSETFSGTVTGQSGDGIPQGSVTVSYGSATALCSVNPLSGGSGDSVGFSCSLTATQLAAGSYSNVVATFTSTGSSNPDFTYTGSASSPAQSFTVNPATTSPDNLRIQLSALGLVSNVGGLYGITVTNLASTATTGAVTITDVLPAGLSYIGVLQFPSAFHCSATLGTVTCTDTSPIAAHANDYLVLVVGVSARSGTVITNTVNLTPVGTPAGNYTATATSTVVSLHR